MISRLSAEKSRNPTRPLGPRHRNPRRALRALRRPGTRLTELTSLKSSQKDLRSLRSSQREQRNLRSSQRDKISQKSNQRVKNPKNLPIFLTNQKKQLIKNLKNKQAKKTPKRRPKINKNRAVRLKHSHQILLVWFRSRNCSMKQTQVSLSLRLFPETTGFSTCCIVMFPACSLLLQMTSLKSPKFRASVRVMKAETSSFWSWPWIKTLTVHQQQPRVQVPSRPRKPLTSLTLPSLKWFS